VEHAAARAGFKDGDQPEVEARSGVITIRKTPAATGPAARTNRRKNQLPDGASARREDQGGAGARSLMLSADPIDLI